MRVNSRPGATYCQVIQTLRAALQAPVPEPFPQNAQYKKNLDKNATEGPAVKCKKIKKKRGPAQVADAKCAEALSISGTEIYSPQRYSLLRTDFIDKERQNGATFSAAKGLWDKSDLKRQLLGPVSLPELKKRRFVPKECQSNPWAD